jgi:putative methionine-R-sulfoxide reductase with GAF domain
MDAQILQRITAAVTAPGARDERALEAADLIRHGTGQRWVGIYTVTDSEVFIEAWSGPGPPAFPTLPRDRGLTAHALRTRAPALSNDVAGDPRYLTNQDDSGSELVLPIAGEGELTGTLDVESGEVGAFDGASIALLERCARALAALWDEADDQETGGGPETAER